MSRSKSAAKIPMSGFDELFQPTQLEVKRMEKDKVIQMPLCELYDFHNHPFQVRDDDEMQELAESIRHNGILVPAIVRVRKEGGYELISGHRRKHGAEIAELETMPVVIKDYTDDEAIIAMADANLQREHIYPSEKAKAYKMKYEAIKHQGKNGGDSLKTLEEQSGDSRSSIQRFLRLNDLSEVLLQMVDAGKIGIVQGVDLSFLSSEELVRYLREYEMRWSFLRTRQEELKSRIRSLEKSKTVDGGNIDERIKEYAFGARGNEEYIKSNGSNPDALFNHWLKIYEPYENEKRACINSLSRTIYEQWQLTCLDHCVELLPIQYRNLILKVYIQKEKVASYCCELQLGHDSYNKMKRAALELLLETYNNKLQELEQSVGNLS